MDRTACVDVPALPLQLLGMRHPAWKGLPVVVVAEDKPQGIILWSNEQARAHRILPGHRYAHGLSLARDLRAGVVEQAHIDAGVDAITSRLRDFSPDVEPCSDEPGVFWLSGAGLQNLFRSAAHWGRGIAAAVRERAFDATVVVGYTRFASYAVARSQRGGVTVFRTAAEERAASRRVPLSRLDIEPRLRDDLGKLGVVTLGGFLRLPVGGLIERFGAEAHRLHRLASGAQWDPLQPRFAPEPFEHRILLDDPEIDATRLVFAIKRALHPVLDRLAAARAALATLFVEFSLYRFDPAIRLEVIRPAEPTLDARTLLRLVHLRLESSPPPAGVVEILVSAEEVPASREQLDLFASKPRRDLMAADEAFARLRAELGNKAIIKATMREGHLPEARYAFVPLEKTTLPAAKADENTPRCAGTPRPLVRRIRARPTLLPPQNQHVRDDGWLLRGLDHGPVTRVVGPYIVSGGWWAGEVHREYHFAETRDGAWLWVYYDRRRRRWFLHGVVG